MRPVLRFTFGMLGFVDWVRFAVLNRFVVEGRDHLAGLPPTGVLLVSNHLTYYMDVLAIHHALTSEVCTPLDGFRANLDVRFVAAFETLNERGLVPRIFNHTGAVLTRRTWRDGECAVKRQVDPQDLQRIRTALRSGWLITFPQGTTTPGAAVRKGTAHVIRECYPAVIPVVLSGFDRAFDRKGFRRISRNVELKVRFGRRLTIQRDDTIERIQDILTKAIAPSETPPRKFGRRAVDEVNRREADDRPEIAPSA